MRDRRGRSLLGQIWRKYRWLIVVLFAFSVCIWLMLVRDGEPDDDLFTANGVLRKLYAPYDSGELRWLMTSWPGALFIVDAAFLDCIAKTAEKFGVDFCMGILSQNNVVTFGSYPISDEALKNFTDSAGKERCVIVEELRCEYRRERYSELPYCQDKIHKPSQVAHVFIGSQDGQLIHIVIFQTLSDSLSVTSKFSGLGSKFASCRKRWKIGLAAWNVSALTFGKTDRVYERVHLQSISVNSHILDIPLIIPTNVEEFRHPHYISNFIPCNKTSVEAFRKAHPNTTSVDNDLFRTRSKKILFRTKKILDDAKIPWWISSGTLLGWFRQCDIIPYSHDIDIGIFIKDYNRNLADLFEDHDFETAYRLGTVNDSMQLSFAFDETKLDIYFFYEEGNITWNGATAYVAGQKFKYVFPRFSLCWTSFLGILVRIPCQSLSYILANYGEDWFAPVEQWDWRTSPPNSQLNGFWTQEQRKEAIYLNPRFYPENLGIQSANGTV